jgi:SagB-type dehydrogenase family enzyme
MIRDIRRFYDRQRNRRMSEDKEGEVPITHVHVFHKEYPRLPSVELPEIDRDTDFETLLDMRKSTRYFSDRPVKLKELSKVLGSCRVVDVKREPERRSYPSGGARFPVELYVASFNVDGLNQGAYHYNMLKRELEQLWKTDLRSRRRELISPYLENPAVTILFTSVVARSEVKYGIRAYPYSLIEAGHMGQNIHLACGEIGLGSCSVSGFVDDTAKEIFDLTEDEIPIYTISIGWEKK